MNYCLELDQGTSRRLGLWCVCKSGSHVSHHDESCLLGLEESIHLALQVVLLEYQGLAVDLCLTVFGIQFCQLQGMIHSRGLGINVHAHIQFISTCTHMVHRCIHVHVYGTITNLGFQYIICQARGEGGCV